MTDFMEEKLDDADVAVENMREGIERLLNAYELVGNDPDYNDQLREMTFDTLGDMMCALEEVYSVLRAAMKEKDNASRN